MGLAGGEGKGGLCAEAGEGLDDVEGVFAGGYVRDLEAPVFVGDGVAVVVDDVDPGLHGGVKVAGEFDGGVGFLGDELFGVGFAGAHNDVEDVFGFAAVAADVVIAGVVVAEGEVLSGAHDHDLGDEAEAALVHVDGGDLPVGMERGWNGTVGLKIYDGVEESARGGVVDGLGCVVESEGIGLLHAFGEQDGTG